MTNEEARAEVIEDVELDHQCRRCGVLVQPNDQGQRIMFVWRLHWYAPYPLRVCARCFFIIWKEYSHE